MSIFINRASRLREVGLRRLENEPILATRPFDEASLDYFAIGESAQADLAPLSP
jgi:hypothetical protein